MTRFLSYLLLFINICQLIERPDFLGVVTSLGVVSYQLNVTSFQFVALPDKLRNVVYLLAFNFTYDLVWITLLYREYWTFDMEVKFLKRIVFMLVLTNIMIRMFLGVSIWVLYSKNRIRRYDKILEDGRKTHIDFYRSTYRGRMLNRESNKKSHPFRKSGLNNSIINQSFTNSQYPWNNKQTAMNNSYDNSLFKKY